MSDIKDFSKLSWEALLQEREKLLAIQEEAEAALSVLKEQIVLNLATEGIEGKVVGDMAISLRTTYSCPKEVAESLGAITTITQKRIDVKMLKTLYLKKVEIERLVITKTPIILPVKKEENA